MKIGLDRFSYGVQYQIHEMDKADTAGLMYMTDGIRTWTRARNMTCTSALLSHKNND